jgi:hypothetical protein
MRQKISRIWRKTTESRRRRKRKMKRKCWRGR